MAKVDWNSLAHYYDKVSKLESEYTLNQIDCLDITAEDTVLDIGCGPGRISIPVAKRAKSVTALDTFEAMLQLCRENARQEGIRNITTKLLDWHDIVIASRSIGMVHPEKLNAAAKKYVAMIGWVQDDSPSIGALFEGILEDPSQRFSEPGDPIRSFICGYQVAFNRVYDMGILPNVRVVKDGFKRDYPSRETAYKDLSGLREFPADMLPLFRQNADKFLTEHENGNATYCCERWSYVLWWRAKDL